MSAPSQRPTHSLPIAILLARCPRCRRGAIFGRFGQTRESCEACGYSFQAEPGYFTAAWAISFFIGFPVVLVMTMALSMLYVPDWPLPLVVLPAILMFSIFVPLVALGSRVILLYIDQSRQRDTLR